MSPFRILFVVVALAVFAAACSPQWWQQANENPAMMASSLDVQVHTLLGSAEIIYTAASTLLPADKKAETDAAYQRAVIGVNHALTALEDAAQAAQENHQDHPDLTKQVAAVMGAIKELGALVDEFKTLASPKTGAPAGGPKTVDLTGAYADFAQSRSALLRRH